MNDLVNLPEHYDQPLAGAWQVSAADQSLSAVLGICATCARWIDGDAVAGEAAVGRPTYLTGVACTAAGCRIAETQHEVDHRVLRRPTADGHQVTIS